MLLRSVHRAVYAVFVVSACRGGNEAAPGSEARAPSAVAAPVSAHTASAVATQPDEPIPVAVGEPEPDEGSRVKPTSADDLDWIAATIAQLRTRPVAANVIARFGMLDGKNGSFERVKPWSTSFARVSFLEQREPKLRTLTVEVEFAPDARPVLRRVEAKIGRSKATPRIHFDSPERRIIVLEDRKGHNISRVVMELLPKPDDHLVRSLVIDNAEGDASLWAR